MDNNRFEMVPDGIEFLPADEAAAIEVRAEEKRRGRLAARMRERAPSVKIDMTDDAHETGLEI